MKAKCKKQFKQLVGILDLDDEVEIESILSEQDEIISYKLQKLPDGRTIVTNEPDMIQPKGSFVDYKFKSKNGKYYTGRNLQTSIGLVHMSQIFTKL